MKTELPNAVVPRTEAAALSCRCRATAPESSALSTRHESVAVAQLKRAASPARRVFALRPLDRYCESTGTFSSAESIGKARNDSTSTNHRYRWRVPGNRSWRKLANAQESQGIAFETAALKPGRSSLDRR